MNVSSLDWKHIEVNVNFHIRDAISWRRGCCFLITISGRFTMDYIFSFVWEYMTKKININLEKHWNQVQLLLMVWALIWSNPETGGFDDRYPPKSSLGECDVDETRSGNTRKSHHHTGKIIWRWDPQGENEEEGCTFTAGQTFYV